MELVTGTIIITPWELVGLDTMCCFVMLKQKETWLRIPVKLPIKDFAEDTKYLALVNAMVLAEKQK